ncbi:MAG TPA: PAS domain S-box protein, partial [Blastocatellia bacterium]|nr:PAS domain S-box protein [Blastocatellia bacterium]
MKIESGQTRIAAQTVVTRTIVLLFIAALALVAGIFNLRDRLTQKPVPSDGVIWVDRADVGVVAESVDPQSPAFRAGIRPGYVLIGIDATPSNSEQDPEEITEARYVQIVLDQVKNQVSSATPLSYWLYPVNGQGEIQTGDERIADLDYLTQLTPQTGHGVYLALIGLIYLSIGVYVLLLQGRAPYVAHFFFVCLLAFIAHFYSPTEELRTYFDKTVDLADTTALILLGPAFIHFAAIYPLRDHLFKQRRWMAALLYVPAVMLLTVELWLHIEKLRKIISLPNVSLVGVKTALERGEALLFAASMLTSCWLLLRTLRRTNSSIVRQQLKWVVFGLGIAAISFAGFYAPSLISGTQASAVLQSIAIAPLIFIPITLGYSIVRYRLMDVDIVMRRSAAYIIATISVAVLFGSVMAASYEFLRPQLPPSATLLISAIVMSVIAMLFAPVKNWVQERIDRAFYGEKYNYRMTLQEFGRTLSSTTDLNVLLNTLMQRLQEVLSVVNLAIFVEDKTSPNGFKVVRAKGVEADSVLPAEVIARLSSSEGIIRAEEVSAETDAEIEEAVTPRRRLYYYVPCAARSRAVAVIALGRTVDGALLSSEDLDLLRAISGYVAVAIENAQLLHEQEQRAEELAQLKEFNENIIESISVGVMVVNLQGRIRNWNGAMEQIYGISRDEAIGKRIPEVFQSGMLDALRQLMSRSTSDEPVNVYKFRARSFDGRDLTINISLAPLHSKLGEVEGTLIAIEDVTARVDLEQQLQQSEKLSSIGLLAAGVAHEVNTPLTGISSYAQMLLQQIPETDPRHQLLQKI